MKIITAANNKGGVGKTKSLIMLAEYLHRYDSSKKGLLIDFDSQCNLSKLTLSMERDPAVPDGVMPPIHPDFIPEEDDPEYERSTIADIFYGKHIIPYETHLNSIEISPGQASKLHEVEAVRRADIEDKVHKYLNLFLESEDLQNEYDIVFIDTGPSKGPLTISAIRAATHMYIPVVMEEQPLEGLYGMIQLWMQEKMLRPKSKPLELIGVLPNKFRKNTSLHQGMLESTRNLEGIGKYIMPVLLSDRITYAETDVKNASPKSVFDYAETNPVRHEAEAFCNYVYERIFNDE